MPTMGRSRARANATECSDVGVVVHVLVAVGHHRPPPVPTPAPHDVDGLGGRKALALRTTVPMFMSWPVLDGHVERVPPGVEVGDDGLEAPVAVAIDDVAAVAGASSSGSSRRSSGHGSGCGPTPTSTSSGPARAGRSLRVAADPPQAAPGHVGDPVGDLVGIEVEVRH